MSEYFKNKAAIVTGAGSGIGAEICYAFAARGCNIFMVDKNPIKPEIVAKVEEHGVKAATYLCDVSDFEGCKTLIDTAVETFGEIEYLVNNAGITWDAMIKKMTEEQWDTIMNVDVKSVFNLTHHIWPVFEKQFKANGEVGSPGSIINMSSGVGYTANIGQANYGSAKAAVAHFTRHSAREFAKINVTVNGVAPGFIISPITDRLQGELRDKFLSTIPLKRAGTGAEVASSVVFLAENRYITGQIIHVDGGIVMF